MCKGSWRGEAATEGLSLSVVQKRRMYNAIQTQQAIGSSGKIPSKKMTKEERHLRYDFLKGYPVRFSRQKALGKYIADFYSAEAKIVIELDGSQQYQEGNLETDQKRTGISGKVWT